MSDIKPTTAIITLNMNKSINNLLRRDGQTGFKKKKQKKAQLYIIYRRNT